MVGVVAAQEPCLIMLPVRQVCWLPNAKKKQPCLLVGMHGKVRAEPRRQWPAQCWRVTPIEHKHLPRGTLKFGARMRRECAGVSLQRTQAASWKRTRRESARLTQIRLACEMVSSTCSQLQHATGQAHFCAAGRAKRGLGDLFFE